MVRIPPPENDDAQPAADQPGEREAIDCLVRLCRDDPRIARPLLEHVLSAAGRTPADADASERAVLAAFAAAGRRADQDHQRELLLISAAGVLCLVCLASLLTVVYLVRGHPELVKTVLCGVALLVSHLFCGACGYLVGGSRGNAEAEPS